MLDGPESVGLRVQLSPKAPDGGRLRWRNRGNRRGVPPPDVAVFSVAPILVVTVEDDGTTAHVNVGGQGPWVARAIVTLGGTPVLCSPFGGDTGRAARLMLAETGVQTAATTSNGQCGMYVERRDPGGARHCMFEVAAGHLAPRDLDGVYESALRHGIDTGTCVVAGSPFPGHLDPAVVGRLCRDLHAAGVVTVVDLSGEHLDAALDAGVDWLKVADDELADDARCGSGDPASVRDWLDRQVDGGHVRVAAVASSSTGDTLARTPHHRITARGPQLEVVDTRGSGDAMCAALALAHGNAHRPEEAIRIGLAAGAANATRRSTAAPGIDAVLSLGSTVQVDATPVAAAAMGRSGGSAPSRRETA